MTRMSILLALGFAALAPAAPAAAQEFEPPRFEALEQQLRNLDQREYDQLETDRQRARDGALFTQPGSAATRALQDLEARDRQQDFVRRYEEDRAREQRERALASHNDAQRRIAPSSILVVREPALQGLPPAPNGTYYARVNGRLVLVDATSELITRTITPAPDAGVRDRLEPPYPQTGARASIEAMPSQSPLILPSTRVGGDNDPSRVSQYRRACLPGGGPNPHATNPFAAKACPEPRKPSSG
jgi:hypothetical protein